MDKELLEQLINEGLSLIQMGKRLGTYGAKVKYHLTKHNLKILNKRPYVQIPYEERSDSICTGCKEIKPLTDFYPVIKHGKKVPWSYCRLCSRKQGSYARSELKLVAVEYKGGKCSNCGYFRCVNALDFHHVDPSSKEHEINILIKNRVQFDSLKKELDKCVLLCSNCHREHHAGFVQP